MELFEMQTLLEQLESRKTKNKTTKQWINDLEKFIEEAEISKARMQSKENYV